MSQENQVTDGEVVTSEENDLVVDHVIEKEVETTTQAEDTDKQTEENNPAEKTFTQAELDEILEKRTAKLARQRDKERSQREATEQELSRLRPIPATGKPQLDHFSSPEEYADALSDWKISQVVESNKAREAEKAHQSFQDRVTEFREEMEDVPNFNFDKLSRLPLSDAAVEALLDSDMRAKVAAHLLSNKDDVDRISKLSPASQAKELGKLEVRLSSVPAKKISQAPSPISPVGGRSSVVSADLYDPKFQQNTDAWIAAYNKSQADKRKR